MKLLICLIILINIINYCYSKNVVPQSVKLAFTQSINDIRVTWWTQDKMESPVILYSTEFFTPEKDSSLSVEASVLSYDTKGFDGHPTTGIINNCTESTVYYYSVGDKSSGIYSEVYNFTTRDSANNEFRPFTTVFYGDMGYGGEGLNSDYYTVNNVLKRSNDIDFIVHVGDIAYADHTKDSRISGNQTVWNQFLESVNPLTSNKPYMTCPGNHDIFYDLSVYRRTWQMPTDSESSSWYSFDYNGVHFVGFSSEHNYIPLSDQWNWLEEDLKNYRKVNPEGWLVVYSHRPFYCSAVWGWCEESPSTNDGDDELFNAMESIETTVGLKEDLGKKIFNLIEDLLFKYNVDIYISGHQHAEEYSFPVYRGQNLGEFNEPKATVHVTVGTGGNVEGEETQWQSKPTWSTGKRLFNTGFGLLSFYNSTTIGYQFVNNSNNTIIDEFYLTKGHF